MLTRKQPLKRGTKRMKRSRLRAVSEKRRKVMPDRADCCAKVAKRAGGRCEARGPTCTGAGEHVHERLSRGRGGSITDPDNCLYVCAMCHEAIHLFPKWATKRGFLIPSWKGKDES